MTRHINGSQFTFITALVLLSIFGFNSAHAKSKYGPEAKVLSKFHDYFKKNNGPDFWALIPYYVPQQDGKSCSLASVTMVVNALRKNHDLTSDDELVTQSVLLKKVNNPIWKNGLSITGRGVALQDLGEVTRDSLKVFGIEKVTIKTYQAEDTPEFKKTLHEALIANEKSDNDMIIINFLQSIYTGDADVGHIAPLAAYDAINKKVLILDPDRKWYEPYWVSEDTLLKGMLTKDSVTSKNRGFIWIKLN